MLCFFIFRKERHIDVAKFQKGQTSQSVILKKKMITESMIRKSEILNSIKHYDEIPDSLTTSKSTITKTMVNKWHDDSLGVIRYSYNSSMTEHNALALRELSVAIEDLNLRLKKSEANKNKNVATKKTRLTTHDINELKRENEDLKSALAEVYRAYMQLLDNCREDEQIDKAYRKLILDQARILGNNRLALIK
jgi:hypothetical protein